MKTCTKCNIIKSIDDFHRDYRFPAPRRLAACKTCRATYRQPGGADYEDHIKRCKDYRDTHKSRKKEYNSDYDLSGYVRKRRAEDPMFKLASNLRSRLRGALKAKKWKKNSKYSQYIGCEQEYLVKYIEAQFKPGMSWKNYGKWEIDHIKPLSRAMNETELYLRCHFSNLQPLWAIDNRTKYNKE